MLKRDEVQALEAWVRKAQSWSETAQALVGAAGELTLASRDLADRFGDEEPQRPAPVGDGGGQAGIERDALTANLRVLAQSVEDDTRELRERYLATAACIDQYDELLD